MPATTWDTNAKSAGVTLSGGNLVATITAASSNVAATRTLTGKSYWEITATTLPSTMAIGICNRTFVFSSGTLLGANANGLGYRNGGAVVVNGVTLSTIATYTGGNVIRVAVDWQNLTIWFAVGAGNWNNSALNNPATAVGGIDYSSMTLGAMRPAGGATFTTNHVLTAAFSSAGWSFSAPSGFSSVDTCNAVGIATVMPSLVSARQDPFDGTYQFVATQTPGYGYGTGAATTISGTVTEAGVPVAKKVRLYDHETGQFLGEATSNAGTGVYSIPAFGRRKVIAIAIDDPTYRALIYDYVAPV
jgi:hypothetical protein